MKIAINATCINSVESGAKNRFSVIYNKLIRDNPHIDFYILEPKDCNLNEFIFESKNLTFIKTKCLSYDSIQRYLIGIFTIPKIIKKLKIQVYEQSHLPLIKIPNVKTIFTIHDIRYSKTTYNFFNFYRTSFLSNLFLKNAIINSDKIVTVSNTIKEEIKNIYNNEKTVVVYNPLKFSNNSINNKDFSNKFKNLMSNNFFLSVGSFEKRKNYIVILYAAFLLKKMNVDLNFCLVGFRTKYLNKIQKIIKLLKLEKSIFIYHDLPNVELSFLYKNCTSFIYPSKYEGFGIPLIEAIFFKCNIILSNIKIFSELTDRQGIYFDPNSPEDLCHKILNCAYDNKEFKINSDILKKFDLDNISKSIVELY